MSEEGNPGTLKAILITSFIVSLLVSLAVHFML